MSKETTKFTPLNSQEGQDKLKSFKKDENLDKIEKKNQADVEFRDLGAAGTKKDKDTGKENRRMEIIRSFIEKIKDDRIRNLEAIFQETAVSPEHKNEAMELRKRLLDKERSHITPKEIKDNLVIKNISEQEVQQIEVSIAWANKQIETKIDEKVAFIDKLLEGITVENPPTTEKAAEQAETTNTTEENTESLPEELDVSSLGIEVDTTESKGAKPEKTTEKIPKKEEINEAKDGVSAEKTTKEVSEKEKTGDIKVLTEEQLKRKETLDKMQADVSEARKEYLEMDHKKKSAYNRLKKFFGSLTSRSDYDRLGEEDQDVAYYQNLYKNKLTEYRSLRLADEKEEGDSGKEVGERYKLMELEENISLAETRVEVRIENYEGKFSQFVKECNSDLTEKWKKLHWAEKVGVGFAVVGSGALVIGVGSAIMAGAGGVFLKKLLESGKIQEKIKKGNEKVEKYYNHNPKIIDLEQSAQMDPKILKINERLSQLDEEIPKTKNEVKQDELRTEKMRLESRKDDFQYITNVASFRSFLAGKNRKEWPAMSKKPVGELIDLAKKKTAPGDGNSLASKFFMIYRNIKDEEAFKDEISPIYGKETLDEWIKRMAKIAYETKAARI